MVKESKITKDMANMGKKVEDAFKKVATHRTKTKNDDIRLK